MVSTRVKDIMTKEVITVDPEMDVVFAFEKLMKYKISAMPVIDDDGKLVGIITATDLGHNLILDNYELGTQVKNIMVKDVHCISPEDSLNSAIDAMTDNTPNEEILNQLPVLDGDELVGIISDGDIIKHIL